MSDVPLCDQISKHNNTGREIAPNPGANAIKS